MGPMAWQRYTEILHVLSSAGSWGQLKWWLDSHKIWGPLIRNTWPTSYDLQMVVNWTPVDRSDVVGKKAWRWDCGRAENHLHFTWWETDTYTRNCFQQPFTQGEEGPHLLKWVCVFGWEWETTKAVAYDLLSSCFSLQHGKQSRIRRFFLRAVV